MAKKLKAFAENVVTLQRGNVQIERPYSHYLRNEKFLKMEGWRLVSKPEPDDMQDEQEKDQDLSLSNSDQ